MSEPQSEERVYKTPVYIRNAKNAYYHRKKSDPEFAENTRLKVREWHKKKRIEDDEFRERYNQKNIESNRKKTEEKLKDFINGEEFVNLVDKSKTCFNSNTEDMVNLVRNTLLSNIGDAGDEKPLFMKLKEARSNRRIKNICVTAILYVVMTINAKVTLQEFAKYHGMTKQSIQEILTDINRLVSR